MKNNEFDKINIFGKGNVVSMQNIVFESYSDKLVTNEKEINNWINSIK